MDEQDDSVSFYHLPNEIIYEIASYLPSKERESLRRVSKKTRELIESSQFNNNLSILKKLNSQGIIDFDESQYPLGMSEKQYHEYLNSVNEKQWEEISYLKELFNLNKDYMKKAFEKFKRLSHTFLRVVDEIRQSDMTFNEQLYSNEDFIIILSKIKNLLPLTQSEIHAQSQKLIMREQLLNDYNELTCSLLKTVLGNNLGLMLNDVITRIPDRIFYHRGHLVPYIHSIIINNSHITFLPQSLYLSQLNEINLARNAIRNIAEINTLLPNLKCLNLSTNQLHYINPEWFNFTPQLETLYLEYNFLSIDNLRVIAEKLNFDESWLERNGRTQNLQPAYHFRV